MGDHTTLHVNCSPDDKRRWKLTARVSPLNFEDWVSDQLNRAVVDTAPEWLDGLSERARICLLTRGYTCKKQVEIDQQAGYDFAALPNAGPSIRAEILKWLDV